MATDRELLAARIFLRAVLPVTKVLLKEDKAIRRRFSRVTATVGFRAKDPAGDQAACLAFDKGNLSLSFEPCENPDLEFLFFKVSHMNAFFAGKPAPFWIKGLLRRPLLLARVLTLLLGVMILMPDKRPKDPEKRRLKVKMTFYMITTALSQYNKGGDPEMTKWTASQPERIYQITVADDIGAWLRVKAGKTQAGRGVYTRRRPFVHMKFSGVEGALPVVMNDVDMVEAVKRGYLTVEGSPEYGGQLGDFMVRIQNLKT
ncbi:MAG: hypothetical protein JRI97_10240 [Deltaproteobacteria bacterium]|nr:hypothetical protein [Deltaproteobacteria bacterium]